MIALRRAILMKANPVVSLHAHRLFSGRACSCKKDPCSFDQSFSKVVCVRTSPPPSPQEKLEKGRLYFSASRE